MTTLSFVTPVVVPGGGGGSGAGGPEADGPGAVGAAPVPAAVAGAGTAGPAMGPLDGPPAAPVTGPEGDATRAGRVPPEAATVPPAAPDATGTALGAPSGAVAPAVPGWAADPAAASAPAAALAGPRAGATFGPGTALRYFPTPPAQAEVTLITSTTRAARRCTAPRMVLTRLSKPSVRRSPGVAPVGGTTATNSVTL